MKRPQILRPPLTKMVWKRSFDLSNQPSTGNSYRATGFHEMSEVVQVQVIGPVVVERVDRHDGVEEVRGERQRPGVGMDGKYAAFDAGIPNALNVLRGAEPKVSRPNFHTEFSPQKNR